MQSTNDLAIEEMSVPDIKKIITDLNEKNQMLENHLNIMKKCVHVLDRFKLFFETIYQKFDKYMTEEEDKQLSDLQIQLADIYNNHGILTDTILKEEIESSDDSITEVFSDIPKLDKPKTVAIPVYRCLVDNCNKIFATEEALKSHKHFICLKDNQRSVSSKSSEEPKQSNGSQNRVVSNKRAYSNQKERPTKTRANPNMPFSSALKSFASIESQTKAMPQKKKYKTNKGFSCYYPNCQYIGNTLREFSEHRLKAHSLPKESNQSKSGTNEELIVSHNTDSNESFTEWNDQNSDSLFKCSDSSCGQLFSENSDLLRHMEYHKNTTDSPEVVLLDSEECELEVDAPNKSLEMCPTVGQTSDNTPDSVAIVSTYANDRPFKLTLGSNPMTDCQTSFDSNKSVFKCTESMCGLTYKTDTDLIIHVKGVHKKLLKRCPFEGCFFFYHNKRFLWEHTNVFHKNEERPFKCTHPSCCNAFLTEADLNRHITSFHAIDRHSKLSTIFSSNTLSNCYSVKKEQTLSQSGGSSADSHLKKN